MKQTIYILTFILFVLTSCTTDNKPSSDLTTIENEQQGNLEISFENYLKTLDQIPLPFSYNPHGKLPELSKNYNKIGFEKYRQVWASQPLGILYNDNKTVTIIDCYIGDWGLVPFLTTYDKQGNKIDSLAPFKKTGKDMGYDAIEYLTINKDKTILVSDSVRTYALKHDSSGIDETSRKLTIGLTKYTIDENGRIKK